MSDPITPPGLIPPRQRFARMHHYFYDPATGLFTGAHCMTPDDDVQIPAPAGLAVYDTPDALDPYATKLDLATLLPVDYQPTAPAADTWRTWSWDTVTKRWLAVPTLASYQRDKLIELKAAALAASESDITVQSIVFKADATTRAELAQELALAQAEGAGYSCDWERADGTAITLTGAQVKGLLRAISTRLASIRAQFRARKASVAAATTQAQVEAITWTTP